MHFKASETVIRLYTEWWRQKMSNDKDADKDKGKDKAKPDGEATDGAAEKGAPF